MYVNAFFFWKKKSKTSVVCFRFQHFLSLFLLIIIHTHQWTTIETDNINYKISSLTCSLTLLLKMDNISKNEFLKEIFIKNMTSFFLLFTRSFWNTLHNFFQHNCPGILLHLLCKFHVNFLFLLMSFNVMQ